MPIGLPFIMGIIGVAIAMLVGIMIFSSVDKTIDCDVLVNNSTHNQCKNAKNNAWIVIGMLPIALFFVLFRIFGGLSLDDEEDSPSIFERLNFFSPNRVRQTIHDKNEQRKINYNNRTEPTILEKFMLFIGLANYKERSQK